jgi:hypothetical protein
MREWIAVDLDGTLAHFDHWRGDDHIGDPIPEMLARVKRWLAEGVFEVRIFTARTESHAAIEAWCELHFGEKLAITNTKDMGMVLLYDDRCVPVERNTGRLLAEPQ